MSWGFIVSPDHTQTDREREGCMKGWRMWKSETKKEERKREIDGRREMMASSRKLLILSYWALRL